MKLSQVLVTATAVLALAMPLALADEAPKKEAEDSGPLVRLDVVMTRSHGESLVARLPYSLLLNAGGKNARVYGGIQLPIVVRHEGSNTMMYKNAGGSVNARIWALEGGDFKVEVSTELGGVYPTNGDTASEETAEPPGAPVLRSFSTNAVVTLQDGQSTRLSDSADPITGETVQTEVTLHVVK